MCCKSFFTQITLLNPSSTLTNKMILLTNKMIFIEFPFEYDKVALDEAEFHNLAIQHTLYVKPLIAKHLLI